MIVLENCIRTLYEINNKMRDEPFVPYDHSKFTRFFKDYLGGKGKTTRNYITIFWEKALGENSALYL